VVLMLLSTAFLALLLCTSAVDAALLAADTRARFAPGQGRHRRTPYRPRHASPRRRLGAAR
jgi:hypothetical protein